MSSTPHPGSTGLPHHAIVRGTCHHDCPDSCGWTVTVEGGRAVRLRGAPEHPYSRGELCPKVNRLLDRVYHPDRVLTPLRRIGPKGAGEFTPVSWDEALGEVADRVGGVVARHGGEAVLPWGDAGTQGLVQMSSLDRRFFAHLGATRPTGALCGATAAAGFAATYGSGRGADPTEVRFARTVLLWGTNTRLTNRHLWPFVEEARLAGARVIVIDPVRTLTADAADWFIQPRPGTDTALVLAMIRVLIDEDLVDHAYIEAHTEGFDRLAAEAARWNPERAGSVCGLPVDTIVELAREYGRNRPAFIRTLIGAEHREHGGMFFQAVGCLPLITGSWTERGGGLARSTGSWNSRHVDDSVFDIPWDTRTVNMNHLGWALTDPGFGIHALFVWNGNPVVSTPNAGRIREGLARDDLFCVVSEQFLTDTAAFADVVFPATTQLEQVDLVPSWGHLHLGWNEPAIEPVGEAVPNTELWRRLARAMGIDDPMLACTDRELIEAALVDVTTEELRDDPWRRLDVPEATSVYAAGGFATPSGRARLWSGDGPEGGPRFLEPVEGAGGVDFDRFPLVLITPKRHTRFLNSSYSAHHGDRETRPGVELHPVDAGARGLVDGDRARVFNDRGSLELEVQLSERTRPGVACIPWGWWGAQYNVNSLTSDTIADVGGGVAFFDTLVEVERAAPSGGPPTPLDTEPVEGSGDEGAGDR